MKAEPEKKICPQCRGVKDRRADVCQSCRKSVERFSSERRAWRQMVTKYRPLTCTRWRDSFDDFLSDVGPRPTEKHALRRIKARGRYEPGNVSWSLSRTWRTKQDVRDRNLFARYGITRDRYNAILAAQAGGCAICGGTDRLHVDHCHTTKKVRGILCFGCNTAIGHMKDEASRLRLAALYLDAAQSSESV